MVIIMMGVSGAGKTRVGMELANTLGWTFYEGDAFHPAENVRKMSSATPLTDEDREPWLASLRALIAEVSAKNEDAILACSALREEFRRRLSEAGDDVRFVFLSADAKLLHERLARREGHFMPPELLASQFEALEPPQDALMLDASHTPQHLVREIRRAFALE